MGTWKVVIDKNEEPMFRTKYVCPECGSWQTYGKPPYCMWCGAKVEKEEDEDE